MNLRPLPRLRQTTTLLAILFVAGTLGLSTARAVLFYATDDASHNTTAPTGTYADSGWQYEGVVGGFLGTVIGQNYFITALHIGIQTGTFVQDAMFTGGVTTTYNIDTSAFGGNGYYLIPNTDLVIYKTVESFSAWAPLYEGNLELGMTAVVMGRGGARNPTLAGQVTLDTGFGPELKGWTTLNPDGTARWGTNVISGIIPDGLSPVGSLLQASFSSVSGTDEEAMLSSGDSGGGLFVNDGGIWKLAGINYAIDGAFNTSPTDAGAFNAALFDKGGYYEGGGTSWNFYPDLPTDTPSNFYSSQISPYAGTINGLTGVPEPASALLVALLGGIGALRRRSRRQVRGSRV